MLNDRMSFDFYLSRRNFVEISKRRKFKFINKMSNLAKKKGLNVKNSQIV